MNQNTDYTATVVGVNIHPIGQAPDSESTIRLSVEDEGAGPYLVLGQVDDYLDTNQIRIELAALEVALYEARELIANWPEYETSPHADIESRSCLKYLPEDVRFR